jgi:alkylhydroperoxidase family enzyme
MNISRPTTTRISPLPPEERDPESKALIDSIGSGSTDNTFNTLARHPNLLRTWMPFAAGMAVNGELPARIRELAILRTGWNCRSAYEFGQHAALASKVGVSEEEIARVEKGSDAQGWTELEAAILRATDELHEDACIAGETWAVLAAHLNERQLIELPVLVGQYHLVAYMLNSLGIEFEPGLDRPNESARWQ